MKKGYIKLFRCILENPLWAEKPFDKGRAWIDLLLLANHKKGGFWLRGIWIPVKRGQVGRSQLALSARWGWSRDKTRRYLKWLESELQIKLKTIQQNEKLTTIITILNYEDYQDHESTDNTTGKSTDKQQTSQQTNNRQVSNKNVKNIKNVKKNKNKDIYGEFKNVKLAPEEYKKLVEKFGEKGALERIENIGQYLASKGDRYKSHYATILSWERKNGKVSGAEPGRYTGLDDIDYSAGLEGFDTDT